MSSRFKRSRTIRTLEVAACLALGAPALLVAEGVYTREQAERGRALYDSACAECHGAQLEGATSGPLAGQLFVANWSRPGLTLDDFYYIVRKTMPKASPGSMTRAEYSDIVSYILQRNGFPAGDKELTPDPLVMKAVLFVSTAPPASRPGSPPNSHQPR